MLVFAVMARLVHPKLQFRGMLLILKPYRNKPY